MSNVRKSLLILQIILIAGLPAPAAQAVAPSDPGPEIHATLEAHGECDEASGWSWVIWKFSNLEAPESQLVMHVTMYRDTGVWIEQEHVIAGTDYRGIDPLVEWGAGRTITATVTWGNVPTSTEALTLTAPFVGADDCGSIFYLPVVLN